MSRINRTSDSYDCGDNKRTDLCIFTTDRSFYFYFVRHMMCTTILPVYSLYGSVKLLRDKDAVELEGINIINQKKILQNSRSKDLPK